MSGSSTVSRTLSLVASAGAFFLDKQPAFWPRVGGWAVAVAAISAGVVLILDDPSSVSTAATLPVLAFQIYFALYWLLLVRSQCPRPPPGQAPEKRSPPDIIPFVRYALMLALSFAVFVGPVGVVMLGALSGFSGVHLEHALRIFMPETFVLRCLLAGPVFLALISRLLLVFPAHADGHDLTLRQSWVLATGIGWLLFGTQLLCAIIGLALFAAALAVPWSLLGGFPSLRLLAVGLISIAVTVTSAIYIALATHCLGKLYAQRTSTLSYR